MALESRELESEWSRNRPNTYKIRYGVRYIITKNIQEAICKFFQGPKIIYLIIRGLNGKFTFNIQFWVRFIMGQVWVWNPTTHIFSPLLLYKATTAAMGAAAAPMHRQRLADLPSYRRSLAAFPPPRRSLAASHSMRKRENKGEREKRERGGSCSRSPGCRRQRLGLPARQNPNREGGRDLAIGRRRDEKGGGCSPSRPPCAGRRCTDACLTWPAFGRRPEKMRKRREPGRKKKRERWNSL